MAPSRKGTISKGYEKVIISALRTRYRIGVKDAKNILPTVFEQWGKLRRLEGGDTMHARDLVPDRLRSRDASFVRVREYSGGWFVNYLISSVISSKLLSIKTHGTDTVLKNSSPQHSLVSCCSSSS
jgi:hypothetical protein